VKLNVKDRLRLLAILPEQGDLLTLKIVRELREDLSFTEKEHKDWKIKVKGDMITWDDGGDEREYEFGEQANELIKKQLRELDLTKTLKILDLELWEKFIGEEE